MMTLATWLSLGAATGTIAGLLFAAGKVYARLCSIDRTQQDLVLLLRGPPAEPNEGMIVRLAKCEDRLVRVGRKVGVEWTGIYQTPVDVKGRG
jgi:hypothetical protein